jgi:hypothetical protein
MSNRSETTDRHLPPSKSQLRDAVLWTYQRLSVDGGMSAQEQATTRRELGNVLFGRSTPDIDGWKERIRNAE